MRAWLQCTHCAAEFDLGPQWNGCPACRQESAGLEVRYDLSGLRARNGSEWLLQRGEGIWKFADLLPLVAGAQPISLGEGDTPLVRSRRAEKTWGLPRLYWKNETTNPTWSHKDRYNSVSVTQAPALGFAMVTTSSTGNHGVSAAAYSSVAGLECMVFYPPETSWAQLYLTGVYGGTAVVTSWEARKDRLRELVESGRWYPSTSWGGRRTSNPFGLEGYKTIAFELVRDLGRVPEVLIFPVAAGNLLYGTWKGFRELRELGWIAALPRIIACQSSGANALGLPLEQNLDYVPVLDAAYSVATSTRERTADIHALRAIRESGGAVVAVDDDAVMAAMGRLGREGICVEPSSAVPAAVVERLAAEGRLDPAETAVAVLTSSGVKWPELLPEVAVRPPARIGPSGEELQRLLQRLGL